ncbi:MAG: carboxypeptidase M32 [Azospirillum brasilense]|nr:MAG: carboxypeptidase M32 [Azospirillum brasilense]
MSATSKLEARFKQIASIDAASGILHWDAATMLPGGSTDARGDQLAALAEISHEKLTDPALADWFAAAQSEPLEDWRRTNLDEMHWRWSHATSVPQALVSALTKLRLKSEHQWRSAKETSDYAGFLPIFREVIALTREVAQAKAEALALSPYDALLDSYDRGLRRATIDPVFAQTKTWLPAFVGEVIAHQQTQPAQPLNATVPVATQEALGRAMMLALGFDTTRGRIDISAHPFCGGAPGDVRITTRYREDRFTDALYGVLHETGHALYEQGLPEAWRGLPIGEARGMSMHESQSLFVEMQVSRSRAFLKFLLPQLTKTFGLSGSVWDEANVYRNLTRVERSHIRVNADEVTYPLHVIWRYELEQALLDGSLDAADLPTAWAEKTQAYLGITPPDHAHGCLQDIHWPEGMFGYFPTYTLGAMTAAQLMAACRRALPQLDAELARGDFAPMLQWLRTHVHSKASSMRGEDILRAATGEALNPAHFEAHLRARYLA